MFIRLLCLCDFLFRQVQRRLESTFFMLNGKRIEKKTFIFGFYYFHSRKQRVFYFVLFRLINPIQRSHSAQTFSNGVQMLMNTRNEYTSQWLVCMEHTQNGHERRICDLCRANNFAREPWSFKFISFRIWFSKSNKTDEYEEENPLQSWWDIAQHETKRK